MKGFSGGSAAVAHTWEIGSLAGAGVEKVFAGTIVDGTGSGSSTAATNITKLGDGTLTLAGSNPFRGNVTVSAGTLKLTNSLALQNSTLTTGGVGLVFDSSVVPHAFSIGGLSGTNDLPLQDNAATPNPIDLTVGGTTQNITSTYNGALTGAAASLTKIGTGTLTLGGNNTYAGPTTVMAGTLRLGAADRIANASNLVLSGGTFATGGFNETLGTLGLATTSTLDLATTASVLHFADSHALCIDLVGPVDGGQLDQWRSSVRRRQHRAGSIPRSFRRSRFWASGPARSSPVPEKFHRPGRWLPPWAISTAMAT